MQTYIVYKSEIEGSIAMILENDSKNLSLLASDAKIIAKINAKSWEIAQMKKHELLGWEPYRPMIVTGNDIRSLIPQNKHDIDNFRLLKNIGYPENKLVIKELFIWIQDMNWPIAKEISQYLGSLGSNTIEQIREVFFSKDSMWIYWTLCYVVELWSIEEIKILLPDLLKLRVSLSVADNELREVIDSLVERTEK